jgi:hypothetical protein
VNEYVICGTGNVNRKQILEQARKRNVLKFSRVRMIRERQVSSVVRLMSGVMVANRCGSVL